MKKLLFAAALLCAPLTMTACATTGPAPSTSVRLNEGKALAAGFTSLKFAEDTATALSVSGKLHGPDAIKVSADLKLAHQLLTSAKALYQANPSADISGQIAQAAALAAEILTLANAHK